ncbi:TRAP transporter small permease [Thermodesulfobacteriota bacterium]
MRNKPASYIGRIFDRILSVGVVLSSVLLVFIMLSISFDVILRYTINLPLEWAVEISEYILVGMTFFATAWVLKRDGHVKMDQLFNRLSPRAQTILNVITSTLSTITCLIIAWYSILVTLDHIHTNDSYFTTLEFPKWPVSAIIVVGFILLLFQFLRRTYGYLTDLKASPNQ